MKYTKQQQQQNLQIQIDSSSLNTQNDPLSCDQDNNNSNNNKKPQIDLITNEKLILFLNECHLNEIQYVTQNSTESTSSVKQQFTLVKNSEKNNQDFLINEDSFNGSGLFNSNNNNNLNENEEIIDPMAMDDCAIIPDSSFNLLNNNKIIVADSGSATKNDFSFTQILIEHLKSGLTFNSSKIKIDDKKSSSDVKEGKELTFKDIFDLISSTSISKNIPPKTIKLKYDWIVNENNNTSINLFQNKQQRFYINTLVTVASSFLNDLQKPNLQQQVSNSSSNNNNSSQSNSPALNQQASAFVSNANNSLFKTPNLPAQNTALPSSTNIFSSTSGKSIAIVQPNESPNLATILPLDDVLQKISEQQANKTKKLLSDLSNSKRRSRQRRPIMIVNNSQTRTNQLILPKLSINGQTVIINQIQSQQQQQNNELQNQTILNDNNIQSSNIVFSGPVAAVARQIVNNGTPTTNTSTNPTQIVQRGPRHITLTPINSNNQQPLSSEQASFKDQPQNGTVLMSNNSISKTNTNTSLSAAFHQAYSNLIPQILSNLIESSDQSSNSNDDNNSNNNNNNQNNEIMQNIMNIGSPTGLTDMSLLELSLNNADSLFPNHNNNNQNNFVIMNGGEATMTTKSSNNNIMNGGTSSDNNFSVSADKLIRNFTSFLNENSISLSGILSSLYVQKQPDQEGQQSEQQSEVHPTTSSNISMNENNNKTNYDEHASTRHSSVADINNSNQIDMNNFSQKLISDMTVEWTDSLSLSGFLLGDMQTPEKQPQPLQKQTNLNIQSNHTGNQAAAKSMVSMNENSRDSIFYNMETIMDIMPSS